jgi:hypothetical protein
MTARSSSCRFQERRQEGGTCLWRAIIEAAEAAIDEKVCDIYGLSPQEVIIINSAPLMETATE